MKVLILTAFLGSKEQPLFVEKAVKAINAETRHAIRFGHNITTVVQLRAVIKEKPPEVIAFTGYSEDTMLILIKDLAKSFPERKFKILSYGTATLIPNVTHITSLEEVSGVKAIVQEELVHELQSA
jgi:hypothetical protein